MKSSSPQKQQPRRTGGGYKLGPRKPHPLPPDAVWATSNQVCNRYGDRSQMWLWRKMKEDPLFPKPAYDGRLMMFSVAELDKYDRILLSKRSKAEPTRKAVEAES